MRKIALLVGSLLLISTGAMAKEIMPEPVAETVPEKVVEIVEKPVIVYRDKEVEVAPETSAWRPNGYLDMYYYYYGAIENKNKYEARWSEYKYNYGYFDITAGVNMTEKQKIETYITIPHALRDSESYRGSAPTKEFRLRHYYTFDNVPGTKIHPTSRLTYGQYGQDGDKWLEASMLWDFYEYFPSTDNFRVDKFGIRTGYNHNWEGVSNYDGKVKGHGNGYGEDGYQLYWEGTTNKYFLNLETKFTLPYGFSAEINLKTGYDRHREPFAYDYDFETYTYKQRKGELYANLEAYLYYWKQLYTSKDNKFGLGLSLAGGFDDYRFRQHRVMEGESILTSAGTYSSFPTHNKAYSAYFQPSLSASYQATDNVSIYLSAGAEYRNFAVERATEASHWRWKPTAYAGVSMSF